MPWSEPLDHQSLVKPSMRRSPMPPLYWSRRALTVATLSGLVARSMTSRISGSRPMAVPISRTLSSVIRSPALKSVPGRSFLRVPSSPRVLASLGQIRGTGLPARCIPAATSAACFSERRRLLRLLILDTRPGAEFLQLLVGEHQRTLGCCQCVARFLVLDLTGFDPDARQFRAPFEDGLVAFDDAPDLVDVVNVQYPRREARIVLRVAADVDPPLLYRDRPARVHGPEAATPHGVGVFGERFFRGRVQLVDN